MYLGFNTTLSFFFKNYLCTLAGDYPIYQTGLVSKKNGNDTNGGGLFFNYL